MLAPLTRQFITARLAGEAGDGNKPRLFMYAGHPTMPLFGWNGSHEVGAHPTMLYDFLDNEIAAREDAPARVAADRGLVPPIEYFDAAGRLNIVREPRVPFTGAHGILRVEGLGDVETPETLEVTVTMVLPPPAHQAMLDRYAFDFAAPVRGLPAMMWLGWLDAAGEIIDNLVPWMTLTLTTAAADWSGRNFEFRLMGTPGVLTTQSPTRLPWSAEQQRAELANQTRPGFQFDPRLPSSGAITDTGFDDIESLATRTAFWAEGSRRTPEPLVETGTEFSVVESVITQILLGIPPTPGGQ